MKKLFFICSMILFFTACTKTHIRYKIKLTAVPYPEADEKNYQKARRGFLAFQKKTFKDKKKLEHANALREYFLKLKEVMKLKNVFMKNMKASIINHNKATEDDEITKK